MYVGAFFGGKMTKLSSLFNYFTRAERVLWASSVSFIILSFFLFDRENYLALSASLIGVTSLIFNAKGNPIGQFLMLIFSLLYGIISYSFSYYGEMITYLGMTAPMALFALVSWLRNPFEGKRSEVAVNKIKLKEAVFALVLTAAVTVAFYFILKAFNTAYILPSTLSVSTSFIAVYLTFRRSEYFALAYAANDVVLILLWSMAASENLTYLSVVLCFIAFLVNDIYGYINWKRMHKRQSGSLT